MGAPTPWSRFVLPGVYAPTVTGAPMPGAKLYFYIAGTTEPLDTFKDSTLTTANDNPVEADDSGIFPDIFLQGQSYRVVWTDENDVEQRTWDPVAPFAPSAETEVDIVQIMITVDGNNQTPPEGVCGDFYFELPALLQKAVLMADQPGDVVVDIWASQFVTNTPPTVLNSITASTPPTLSSSQSSIDTVLSGWDVNLPAQSALRFNIESIDTIFRFTLTLVAKVQLPE